MTSIIIISFSIKWYTCSVTPEIIALKMKLTTRKQRQKNQEGKTVCRLLQAYKQRKVKRKFDHLTQRVWRQTSFSNSRAHKSKTKHAEWVFCPFLYNACYPFHTRTNRTFLCMLCEFIRVAFCLIHLLLILFFALRLFLCAFWILLHSTRF